MTELVDYSATANADWSGLAQALRAAGKVGVVRYVVGDYSPGGRGITLAEQQELTAGGIDIAAVWEGPANGMQDGYPAGVAAAKDAQKNLVAAGLPPTMPVYFACDFDAAPGDQATIDAYLRGAATVLGANRVGIYGGFYVVQRCAQNKTAQWFWQTSAWSGGQWFAGNHLEQYDYNVFINGTNCDATRAKQENYGQASKFRGGNPVPTPKPPAIVYPAGLDKGLCQRLFGSFKASNGITVAYSEGDELAALWLASGSYGRIVDVAIYNDSPTAVRIYWVFSDGRVYWRANANEPIKPLTP